jgi:hypothetical protein
MICENLGDDWLDGVINLNKHFLSSLAPVDEAVFLTFNFMINFLRRDDSFSLNKIVNLVPSSEGKFFGRYRRNIPSIKALVSKLYTFIPGGERNA